MPSNVNVTITNVRTTGVNVSVAQRAMDVTISFIDNAGLPHTLSQTVLFPNVLGQLPAAYLESELRDAMIRWHRVAQGIDSVESIMAPQSLIFHERMSPPTFFQRFWLFGFNLGLILYALLKHFGIL